MKTVQKINITINPKKINQKIISIKKPYSGKVMKLLGYFPS